MENEEILQEEEVCAEKGSFILAQKIIFCYTKNKHSFFCMCFRKGGFPWQHRLFFILMSIPHF